MTKEEAIERLKNYTQYRCGGVDLVALNMAIQALEQEPCNDTVSRGVFEQVMWERDTAIEQLRKLGYGLGQKIEPCDDAVSRHAVIEHSYDRYDYTTDKPIEVVNVNEIKELPSVIPTRERGELIYIGESDFAKIYECSVCNTRISGIYGRPNFCPYCGVDMRGD